MTVPHDQHGQLDAAQELPAPSKVTRLLLSALEFYRGWVSPALHTLSPGGCKFLPTCSEYASLAIATHGPARGVLLAVRRLLRCHPFGRGGLDPVPPVSRPPSPPNSSHIPHQPLP